MPRRDAVTREQLVELREQGLTGRDIALKLGIGHNNYSRLVTKYGLAKPRARPVRPTTIPADTVASPAENSAADAASSSESPAAASPAQVIAAIERGRALRGQVYGKALPPIPKTTEELRALIAEGHTFHGICELLQMGEKSLARLAGVLGVEIPRSGLEHLAQVAGNLQTPFADDQPARLRREKTVLERLRQRDSEPEPPPRPATKREQFIQFPAAKARPATASVYLVIDRSAPGSEMAGLLYGASQVAAGLGAGLCHVKLDFRNTPGSDVVGVGDVGVVCRGQDTGKTVPAPAGEGKNDA